MSTSQVTNYNYLIHIPTHTHTLLAFTTYSGAESLENAIRGKYIQTTFSVYKMMENPTLDLFDKALRTLGIWKECWRSIEAAAAVAEIKRNVEMNTFEMTPLQSSKQATNSVINHNPHQ